MKSDHIINEVGLRRSSLLFLLVLLEMAQTQSCTIECSETLNSCIVCFQVCKQQEQKATTFQNCTQVNEHFSSGNGSQVEVFIYGESQCSKKCCSDSLAKILQTFSECPDKEKISRIQVIVIGCVMTLVVICFCVCCCNKTIREKIAGCLCPENIKVKDEKKEVNQSKEVFDDLKQVGTDINLGFVPKYEFGKECSICLSPFCNVSTECGHSFHLSCLMASYSQSKLCPFCRIQVEVICLYCQQCHKYLGREAKLSMIQKFNINICRQSLCQECSLEQ